MNIQNNKNEEPIPDGKGNQYFMDPKVKAHIFEGIAQHKSGKTTKIDAKDFDKLLGL